MMLLGCKASCLFIQVAVITLGEAGCSARDRHGRIGRCSADRCDTRLRHCARANTGCNSRLDPYYNADVGGCTRLKSHVWISAGVSVDIGCHVHWTST